MLFFSPTEALSPYGLEIAMPHIGIVPSVSLFRENPGIVRTTPREQEGGPRNETVYESGVADRDGSSERVVAAGSCGGGVHVNTETSDKEALVESFARRVASALSATPRQYAIYVVFYLAWGCTMNAIGKALAIAEFAHGWQVATCYVLYLVPVSLADRDKTVFEQYVYGVFALAPLELAGYALGTSIAHDGNFLDAWLGPRNFALAMSIFFGIIPPVGNGVVRVLDALLSRPSMR